MEAVKIPHGRGKAMIYARVCAKDHREEGGKRKEKQNIHIEGPMVKW
jgi:hypothetical protein